MSLVTLSNLVQAAAASEVVSFPTDTVPALAVQPEAADKIFALKQRSYAKPLILMGATAEQLWPFIEITAPGFTQWQALSDRFWPGALTLVLPARADRPNPLNPREQATLGIRVPQHPIAQDILHQTGPLATTSANLSGQPALTAMPAIAEAFPTVFVLDRPEVQATGQPSTVVRWTTTGWQLLRAGGVQIDLAMTQTKPNAREDSTNLSKSPPQF